MSGSETVEKPQAAGQQAQPSGSEKETRPCGTMFDPETIRKFLEQIKKEDQ
ncbi:MAG: hypothetical protein J1E43_10825 [Christensenellaceae bacterium]|nr:hypothetical protein [Christensenellaceae bacterium]